MNVNMNSFITIMYAPVSTLIFRYILLILVAVNFTATCHFFTCFTSVRFVRIRFR